MESSVLPTEEPDILPWHEALCATCAPTVLVGCSKTFNNLSSKITLPGSVCLPQLLSLVLLCTASALSLLRDTPPDPFFSTRTDALLCLRGRTERFTMPEDEPAFLLCSLVQPGACSEHSWQVLAGLRCWWRRAAGAAPGGAPGVLLARDQPCGKCPWSAPSELLAFPLLCLLGWCVPADVPPSSTPPMGSVSPWWLLCFSQALLTPFSVLCWPRDVTRTQGVWDPGTSTKEDRGVRPRPVMAWWTCSRKERFI